VSPRRVALAVATAAALAAYALAFLPATGLRWAAVVLACALAAGAHAVRWTAAPPRVVRWTGVGLRGLLITIGGLVVLSRQFPLVRYGDARRTAVLVGGALALAALAFLAGRQVFRVPTHLALAIVGVLVAAGLERDRPWFVPLAGAAGLALWLDAFRTGGPRRFGAPAVLSAAAGAALAAGIAWFLPVAQPHVQEFVARAYSEGQTGLSDRSELGEFASLARSRRIVARVWADRPQRLRMQVFSQFDGRRWVAFPRDGRLMTRIDRPPLGALLGSLPGHVYAGAPWPVDPIGLAQTRVLPELWMEDGWGLLSPAGPVLLVWPDDGVALDDRGLVTTGGARARLYGVANRPRLGAPAPPGVIDLALPVRVDPRVRALAETLRQGDDPGPRLVSRTLEHLRTRYRYTLDVGRFDTIDPLSEFLFDKRAGYCEYFASAAVVLLRLQGVPARYVKGVSVRPDAQVGDHYVVRESDAHAWADVWTAETGWAEVDPTPAGGWELTHPDERPGLLAMLWERVASVVAQAWARWRQDTWPWLTAALSLWAEQVAILVSAHRAALSIAALAIGVALVIARRRPAARRDARRRSVAIAPELAAALRRIERCWARAGSPRPPARGLLEHLEDVPPHALSAEERALSERVVRAVYESAFAGRPPGPADLEVLAAAVRSLPR